MTTGDVKKQMMSLWMRNFGDSKEYVSLVFDHYFNPENIAFREDNNNIVSALLGVPYEFKPVTGKGLVLRGLYLCGLSTEKNYRGRGLMTSLLEEINDKAARNGFDFTFLIPSNEGIRRYYKDRGYANTFFKFEDHYVRGHKFVSKEEEPLLEGIELTSWIDYRLSYPGDDAISSLVGFLTANEMASGEKPGKEAKLSFFRMVHTPTDWKMAVEDNELSGGEIFIATGKEDIVGVAFIEKSPSSEVKVKRIVCGRPEVADLLLEEVSRRYSSSSLIHYRDVSPADLTQKSSGQVWEPFYAQNNPKDAQYEDVAVVQAPVNPLAIARPYGMCRLLDIWSLLKKFHHRGDFDLMNLTEREMGNIILSKPSISQTDGAALFGLPDLNLNISLLLE